MSRIGKLPISIPAGVTVSLKDNVVTVKGPKGELSQKVDPSIIVKVEDNQVTFAIDEKSLVDVKQKRLSTVCTAPRQQYGCWCQRRLQEDYGARRCRLPCKQPG